MSTQVLEKYFSASLRDSAIKNLWFLKLQVNPMAHQTMPADYKILTTANNYLVECKEINNTNKNTAFPFEKLTQLIDLLAFEDKDIGRSSYLCLMFWKGNLKKSEAYMIPIIDWFEFTQTHKFKSINERVCKERFGEYRLEVHKALFVNLNNIFL